MQLEEPQGEAETVPPEVDAADVEQDRIDAVGVRSEHGVFSVASRRLGAARADFVPGLARLRCSPMLPCASAARTRRSAFLNGIRKCSRLWTLPSLQSDRETTSNCSSEVTSLQIEGSRGRDEKPHSPSTSQGDQLAARHRYVAPDAHAIGHGTEPALRAFRRSGRHDVGDGLAAAGYADRLTGGAHALQYGQADRLELRDRHRLHQQEATMVNNDGRLLDDKTPAQRPPRLHRHSRLNS